MSYTLTTRAFFFNAQTDYLPYYKHFTLSIPKDATVKEILIAIHQQNENFAYPDENLILKINDLIVTEETPLVNIVTKLGLRLCIEPASSYRSTNGLILNDDDFMKSFELLAPYASNSDQKYYQTLYALHYASETSHFDREYIGDAILVLAHKMISEGNTHKEAILHAISSARSGLLDCEYENNLFNAQSYEAVITALKDMVRTNPLEKPSLIDKVKQRIFSEKEVHHTIDNLQEKHVAYYPAKCYSTTVLEKIKALGMSMVTFDRMHKLSGKTILPDNMELALKKAGMTLLEAFDAGAEVLIVEDSDTCKMMQKHFKAIENNIGRKMIGFELISSEDFLLHM